MRDAMPDPNAGARRGADGASDSLVAPVGGAASLRSTTDRPIGRPVSREPMRGPDARSARTPVAWSRRPRGGAPRAVLDAPSPELQRLLGHLQTTVRDFVHARQAAGVTIDRVIPEVVCLVRESESCEGWRDSSERLMAQVVRWSIDAYHDAARVNAS